MSKGNNFERLLCKEFSMWWANGKRDDIFWRTQQSGGRATQRRKKGETTAGQYGDMTATDPIGLPLLEAFTFEFKRGYAKTTLHDLLDCQERHAHKQQMQVWMNKVRHESELASSHIWLLVIARINRRPMIFFPPKVEHRYGVFARSEFGVGVQFNTYRSGQIYGTTLDHFLVTVRPKDIKKWHD